MAIHAHSTTAPVVQTGLLPFVFRPVPPVDDPRSADELLEEIRRTIERQVGNQPALPSPAPLPSLTAALTRRRDLFGAVAAS